MRRRHAVLSVLLGVALAGCETTGNVESAQWKGPSPSVGVVIFSVTHDHGPTLLGRPSGSNVRAYFRLRGPGFGANGFRAFSLTETLSPIMSSVFDDAWGTLYVRELPPGHYELYDWSIVFNSGVSIRELSPKAPPPVMGFDVEAGHSVYLGNLHAVIQWGTLLGLPIPVAGLATIGSRPERDLAVAYKTYPPLQGRVEQRPWPARSPWLNRGEQAPAAPAVPASQPG